MPLNRSGNDPRRDSRESLSFYEQLREREEDIDLEQAVRLRPDKNNIGNRLKDIEPEELATLDSSVTAKKGAVLSGPGSSGDQAHSNNGNKIRLHKYEEDLENVVPASLLFETHTLAAPESHSTTSHLLPPSTGGQPAHNANHESHRADRFRTQPPSTSARPKSLMSVLSPGNAKERAIWRWINTANLDGFMRDVYDYYDGGGISCILVSNALWLLNTLFVAILLTFLGQCVDYSQIPNNKALAEVIITQCTKNMHGLWSLGIWMYCFFFIWKSVQYFLEIRRLRRIREFFTYLLDIPENDMQTISWQNIVARIMGLREQNPRTAMRVPRNLRRYMGTQSKDRLDAHDIANRLMRKENFLIALINKDILNLTLPVPLLRGRQHFSKSMEWYLQFCILDMAFNELGQVQPDFLRGDKRRILSLKLKQRFYFAGILNLLLAPVVLAYVIVVYFFTYYNEYQKDPKLAAARKYTALAEWKFREFNELPHLFHERLHMSYPFATRYLDQFPKRVTEEVARTIAFMSGAITAVLAVGTILDSELFLNFEITKDRTVLFYLGIFGAIWAMSRGIISEETTVFDPGFALRNVIRYTRFMPDNWHGRLHSFEVKQEFSELYKMKVIIFLEEIMGIITTPLLLLFSLPTCSDQVVDFFREFTVHVDGLGYVCSFAVFNFDRGEGMRSTAGPSDVRQDYYATKHGKMAASYYGFLDHYLVNPEVGVPGHPEPASQYPFHPPPTFPIPSPPATGVDVDLCHSQTGPRDIYGDHGRIGRSRSGRAGSHLHARSPASSVLLDPRHQPMHMPVTGKANRALQRSMHVRASYNPSRIDEELHGTDLDDIDSGGNPGLLEESTWETSPGLGLTREQSAGHLENEADLGVLGMIHQFRQQHNSRRGGVI